MINSFQRSLLSVVHSDPDILGGIPVLVGTHVPMKTLLDYLEAGDSLEVFLDHFPSVSREQAIANAVLKYYFSGLLIPVSLFY